MRSDALVTLLTWDRLVPWKVLSLPRRVADQFVPVGYGSKGTVFRGRARQHSTLWVVTRPIPEALHPPSLVAQLTVEGLYTREDCPAGLSSKGVEDLSTNVWQSVTQAGLIVAEVSVPNPNVYYEIGLADALGKPIFVFKQQSVNLPADFGGEHYYVYDLQDLGAGRKRLADEL